MRGDLSFFKRKAHADFDRARNRAFFNELFAKIFDRQEDLLQFDEVKYLLSPTAMAYRGIRSVRIDRIVGSEGRYRDFDRLFLPKKGNARQRWVNIDVAKQQDLNLAPISVYKIGDFYFVRDGNHRVSVARQMGQEFIDAEVVELFSRVKLRRTGKKDLLLAESYGYFLERTQFDLIAPGQEIRLTNPWGYYRLIEHIENYRYFMGEREKRPIELREAVLKWYQQLYLPVTRIIRKRKVLRKFPKRTAGDLYIWTMDHWHFLKIKLGNVPIEHAIDSYSRAFGKVGIREFLGRLARRFRKPGGGAREKKQKKR